MQYIIGKGTKWQLTCMCRKHFARAEGAIEL